VPSSHSHHYQHDEERNGKNGTSSECDVKHALSRLETTDISEKYVVKYTKHLAHNESGSFVKSGDRETVNESNSNKTACISDTCNKRQVYVLQI